MTEEIVQPNSKSLNSVQSEIALPDIPKVKPDCNTFGQAQLNTQNFTIQVKQFEDDDTLMKENTDVNTSIRMGESKIFDQTAEGLRNKMGHHQLISPKFCTNTSISISNASPLKRNIQNAVNANDTVHNVGHVQNITTCQFCQKLEPFEDLIRPCLCLKQNHQECLKREIHDKILSAGSQVYEEKTFTCDQCKILYLIKIEKTLFFRRLLSSKIQKIYAALLAPLLVSIAGLVYWLAFISMADEREKNNLLQVVFLIICLILVLFVIAAYFTMEIKRLATQTDWKISDVMKRQNLISIVILNLTIPLKMHGPLNCQQNRVASISTILPLQITETQQITEQN